MPQFPVPLDQVSWDRRGITIYFKEMRIFLNRNIKRFYCTVLYNYDIHVCRLVTKDSVLEFRVSDHHTLVRDSVIGEATLNLADVVARGDNSSKSSHKLCLTSSTASIPSDG